LRGDLLDPLEEPREWLRSQPPGLLVLQFLDADQERAPVGGKAGQVPRELLTVLGLAA
jgi:hypothetical protein